MNRNGNLDWLQRAGELTDVNILVEGVSYPAHRVILAAHSEYFHRLVDVMFARGLVEVRFTRGLVEAMFIRGLVEVRFI